MNQDFKKELEKYEHIKPNKVKHQKTISEAI